MIERTASIAAFISLPLRYKFALVRADVFHANLLFFLLWAFVTAQTPCLSYYAMSTIVALATGENLAAIALIRLSGCEAHALVRQFFVPKSAHEKLPPRRALFGNWVVAGDVLDQVVVTLFSAPHSYTGEDMAEISCHGSPYIVQTLIRTLIAAGAIPAQPGEYTYRAYLNNKLDLAQAEAVGELIHSRSEAQHHAALQQLSGTLSAKIAALRAQLLELTALVELEIDFSDQDVEFVPRTQLSELTTHLHAELAALSATFQQGDAIRQGLPVTIAGAPNAGKSTLLNHFLQEERAIVSDIPGTTRDTIHGEVQIKGITIRFTDTAGLRETSDPIERLGIERALNCLQGGIFSFLLIDATTVANNASFEEINRLVAHLTPNASPLLLLTKADLLAETERQTLLARVQNAYPRYTVVLWGARIGLGETEVRAWLEARVTEYLPTATGFVITNERHYRALLAAEEETRLLAQGITQGLTSDLLAHHLRQINTHLANITGEIAPAEVLSTIFGKFCIGK